MSEQVAEKSRPKRENEPVKVIASRHCERHLQTNNIAVCVCQFFLILFIFYIFNMAQITTRLNLGDPFPNFTVDTSDGRIDFHAWLNKE